MSASRPSFTPRASQLLTNHVKAFPRSCLGQASQSFYMRKSCLTPWVTLSRKRGDPTLRVILTTPKVTLTTLKVILTTPKVTLTTLDKCQMCHINARRQGEVKWMKSNRVSLWQRACARNALDFAILYRQCTNLFIFRFVSLHHILYTILYLYVIICNLFICNYINL